MIRMSLLTLEYEVIYKRVELRDCWLYRFGATAERAKIRAYIL